MLLNEMEIFYHVVGEQSFSKAAEKLNVSKSYISKKVTRLESALKTRLLTRSTRELILTEEGQYFYQQCAKVVEHATKGYDLINEFHGEPAGILKLSIPPAFALHVMQPILSSFMKKYPNVILDVRLESQIVDVIASGYDLVLRSGKLEDSNLIAQRICEIENVICATPAYLTQYGSVEAPEDYTKHGFVFYHQTQKRSEITVTHGNKQKTINVQGKFFCNHLELAKQMVLADAGLGMFPKFMVQSELESEQLQQCLPEYELPSDNLYAIYPEREFMLPKLSQFLQLLKESLSIG